MAPALQVEGMTSLAGVFRCSPPHTFAGMSSRVWLPVHLVLYFALDLATLSGAECTGGRR